MAAVAAAAGSVVSIASVVNSLKTVLDNIQTTRRIAVAVSNETKHPWEAISVYFSSGTSDAILPLDVPTGKAILWGARKTSGPIARGAVGVFTYYIRALDKTLAIMYSVPFDLNLFRNWWNVKLYGGRREASKQSFKDMDGSDKVKGDNTWHTIKLDSGVSVKGAMGSTGQSKLEIKVGIESNT
ncbi:DELTA-stichotoxin-She4b-like [Porites lutea]|uniref:DELTA-stichotoxin-She4b-like n=1 Tax=Porites lutea TaxID=51062 RepID=UPI003CC57017